MAVGILHAVLPSPGPLNLKELGTSLGLLQGHPAQPPDPCAVHSLDTLRSGDSSEEEEGSTHVFVGCLIQCHQEGVEPS